MEINICTCTLTVVSDAGADAAGNFTLCLNVSFAVTSGAVFYVPLEEQISDHKIACHFFYLYPKRHTQMFRVSYLVAIQW